MRQSESNIGRFEKKCRYLSERFADKKASTTARGRRRDLTGISSRKLRKVWLAGVQCLSSVKVLVGLIQVSVKQKRSR